MLSLRTRAIRLAAELAPESRGPLLAAIREARTIPEKLRAKYKNLGDFGGTHRILDSWYLDVEGPTFGIKDELKRLGLRWDRDRKVWGLSAVQYAHSGMTGAHARKQGYASYQAVRDAQEKAWPRVRDLVDQHNARIEAEVQGQTEMPDPKQHFREWITWIQRQGRLTKRLTELGVTVDHTHPNRYSTEEPKVKVSGNTYALRNLMQKHGFRWNSSRKTWEVSSDDFRVMGVKWMGEAIRALST